MHHDALLVPFGILEVSRGTTEIHQLNLLFGRSRETADFIVDGLELWWTSRRTDHVGVKIIMIELDNGPEINSSRTQFIKRLTEFAHRTGLRIELVYGAPYHSKYNPIERCWGILEIHWNGALLSTIETALKWAGTMTWRGVRPLIHEITKTDERGIKVARSAMQKLAPVIHRDPTLPKWSLVISPTG